MSSRLRSALPALVVLAVLCALAVPAQAQTCAPTWSATKVYWNGDQASLNNINYKANWWTQNQNPATNNGPAGSGQPWTIIGPCGSGSCTVIPGVPSGLGYSNLTSSSLTLSWNASTAGSGCTIEYRVYVNGSLTYSPTGTSVSVSGLSPNTTYSFRVAAIDQAGTSAQSSALSVTTPGGTTAIVQLYQHCNYTGWVANFNSTGNISLSQIQAAGGVNDDASAIKIASGYKVTIYEHDNYGGASVTLTGDTSCFVSLGFNDILSSMKIEQGTNPVGSARSAPYVDISLATGSQVASNAAAANLQAITLAFLVDGGCQATWAGGLGNVSNATFPNGTTVKSQIDALTSAGRKVIIAWGGANGSVLSSCGSASQAQAMYQQAFNAYPNITGMDFDIEGGVNTSVLASALKGLKTANPSKSISLTLPVLPIGLVQAGLDIVNACHNAGFHPDTINIMAMDYGSYYDNGGNMLLSAQQAAQATRNQTGDMIGITPMIGQNDVQGEIFTLSDASALVSWAKSQSYINRLAFWSLSRDNGSCPGQTWASPICSGLSQSTWQFSSIFNGY